jgi:putative ABC transport system permease protein
VGGFGVSVQYGNKRSKNDMMLLGTDENYAVTSSYQIESGRNISMSDVQLGRNVIVIGKKVESYFFPRGNALGKSISLFGKGYKIIGVFAEKGMTQMMGGDKILVVPVSTLHRDKPDPERDYGLSIYCPDPKLLDMMSLEATGVFRSVRELKPKDENNFGIMRMDNLLAELMGQIAVLTFSAIAVAIITLFSAAIGLMNIMLVSVTERTREIGVRKSLGATNSNILRQFLTEAIIICQFGGILGIILGILIGNIIGLLLGTEFLVPWPWVFVGITVCFITGLVSGIYPAWKASRLDPIDALRHE